MRFSGGTLLVALIGTASALLAEIDANGRYRDREAVVLTSDHVELVVLKRGGAFASLTLNADANRLNPMWDSLRADREQERDERLTGAVGHFVCVDGFGQPSEQERAAGMEGHGEAHRLEWETDFAGVQDGAMVLRQSVTLPRVREQFRREIRLLPNEGVVYVRSELESLLDFDRPVNWAEHATIGSPFLERGVTVVDISPNRAITRPREEAARAGLTHRLASNAEFTWPMAPTRAGGLVDLRAAPHDSHSLDHTAHRMDPDAEWAFVTALHPVKRLLLGYVFRPSEFAWLQTWESYPRDRMMARGLEFATQAFDLPRREVVSQSQIFGTSLYRWLPARTTISAGYLMVLTRTPEGFLGVSSIDWTDGLLRIRDDRSGQVIELQAGGELVE